MPADRRRLGRTLRTKKSTPLQPIRETCIEDIRFIPSYPSNTSTNNDSQKPAQLKHKSEKYQQAQILLDLLEKEGTTLQGCMTAAHIIMYDSTACICSSQAMRSSSSASRTSNFGYKDGIENSITLSSRKSSKYEMEHIHKRIQWRH